METKSFNEQKAIIQQAIEKYEEEHVGLSKLINNKEPEYLHMSLEDLRNKTIEELAEASLLLHRYAFQIQRIVNKENAWLRWAESRKNDATGRSLYQVEGDFGWNERMLIAQTQPQECALLNQFIRELTMKIATLSYLPTEINRIADCIKDIRMSKIGVMKHG